MIEDSDLVYHAMFLAVVWVIVVWCTMEGLVALWKWAFKPRGRPGRLVR